MARRIGTVLSEEIEGSSINDTLFGGLSIISPNDAADTIFGGLGDDLIYGNGGNDVIFGFTKLPTLADGNDTIFGGVGNDLIHGNAGRDLIYGNEDNDLIYGGRVLVDPLDNADTIYGGDGNDIIYGNGGDDVIFGGSNVVNPDDVADTIYSGHGDDLIYGNGGNDVLIGGDGNDVIFGGVGADNLDGGSGNDILISAVGSDTLTGGSGDDVFTIQDTISGITTVTDIAAGDSIVFDNISSMENIDIIADGADTLLAINNIISTRLLNISKDDVVMAKDENLAFLSFAFEEEVMPAVAKQNDPPILVAPITDQNAQFDTAFTFYAAPFFSDPDNDVLKYSINVETFGALPGWLSFNNETGAFSGTPTSGDEFYDEITITASDRKDQTATASFAIIADDFDIIGTQSDDVIIGGNTRQTISAGSGNDNISSLGKNDRVYGGSGNDTVNGGSESDTIYGGAGDDNLNGGNQKDRLFGDAGNDTLNGSAENDTLTGGDGNDIFAFIDVKDSRDSSPDIILDYTQGTDHIFLDRNVIQLDPISSGFIAFVYDGANDRTIVNSINAEFSTSFTFMVNSNVVFTDDDFILGFDIIGTSGDDTLIGSDSAEDMFGSDGNDSISAGRSADVVFGGLGNDTLNGGSESDTIYGGVGDDTLNGGNQKDRLFGGAGNDTLDGGAESDILMGGAGSDVFVLNSSSTSRRDTITDMNTLDIIALDDDVFVFATNDGVKTGMTLIDDTDIFNTTMMDVTPDFSGGSFTLGGGATFLYDITDGELWYDSDGDAGGGVASLIATIENFASYTYNASDFEGI